MESGHDRVPPAWASTPRVTGRQRLGQRSYDMRRRSAYVPKTIWRDPLLR
jgi:hypothetical protein